MRVIPVQEEANKTGMTAKTTKTFKNIQFGGQDVMSDTVTDFNKTEQFGKAKKSQSQVAKSMHIDVNIVKKKNAQYLADHRPKQSFRDSARRS